jgi:hypothetical protein
VRTDKTMSGVRFWNFSVLARRHKIVTRTLGAFATSRKWRDTLLALVNMPLALAARFQLYFCRLQAGFKIIQVENVCSELSAHFIAVL